MAYEKVVHAKLMDASSMTTFPNRLTQPTAATGHSHLRLVLAGVTDANGSTFTPNPFNGTLLWDSMNYYLTGVSIGTGASFVIVVETDAIAGFTGLPIAGVSLSTGSSGFVRIPNLHKVPGSPVPTHVNVIRTVGTGTSSCAFTLWATGKAQRGNLSTQGGAGKCSDRTLQGAMWNSARNRTIDDLAADATFTLTAGGASANFQGLDKMALWDQAMFWFVAGATVNGSWQAAIEGTVDGVTYIIAETTAKKLNGTSDAASFPNPKVPMEHYYAGSTPRPTRIIINEIDAGGISNAQVVMVAKSTRGQYR